MRGMRYQPQGAARLNPTNPLAPGLVHSWGGVHAMGPIAVRDMAGRAHGVFGSGAAGSPSGNSWRVGPGGYYLNFDDSGTGAFSSINLAVGDSNGSGSPGSNVFSFAIRARLAGGGALFGGVDGSIEVQIGGNGAITLVKQNIEAFGSSSVMAGFGVDVDIGISYDGSVVKYYLNGIPAGSSVGAKAFVLSAQYYIGYANNGERVVNGTRIYRLDVWNRALPAEQFKAWSDNPWQIFADPYDDEAASMAGAVYTLTTVAGSFALAAAAARLSAARRLPADSGALVLAGSSAKLLAQRRLPGAAGAFIAAAAFAGLLASRRLAGAAGTFVYAGRPVKLFAARRLAADAGAFTLSGGSVKMTYVPAPGPGAPTYTLTSAPGVFGLAGASASLQVRRRMLAATGSIAVAGSPAALVVRRRLAAAVGGYALQGVAVQIRAARRIPAQAGMFDLVGAAAVLKYTTSGSRFDVANISPARISVFDGSGSRVALFGGSGSRVAVFEGSGSRVAEFK